jgi:hypothetical protein
MRRIEFNFGGTVAFPTGPSANRLQVGGGFTVGTTLNIRREFGVQLEYGGNWSTLHGSALGGALSGHAFQQYFDLNGVIRPMHGGAAGVYLLGGGGVYYRSVTVTRATGTSLAPYCDPYLFYCSVVPVTTSAVVGSRSRWDWGLDAGIGYNFFVAPPSFAVYLEVRYHYIFGPQFTDSSGSKHSSDGQYVPITLGLRF